MGTSMLCNGVYQRVCSVPSRTLFVISSSSNFSFEKKFIHLNLCLSKRGRNYFKNVTQELFDHEKIEFAFFIHPQTSDFFTEESAKETFEGLTTVLHPLIILSAGILAHYKFQILSLLYHC